MLASLSSGRVRGGVLDARSGSSSSRRQLVVFAKQRVAPKPAQNHKKQDSSASASISYDKVYTDESFTPAESVSSSITVQHEVGLGRGIYATQDLKMGDTLFVNAPVGPVLKGQEGGEYPNRTQLAHALQLSNLTSADRLRLAMLYDGTLASCLPSHAFQLQQFSLLGAAKLAKEREAKAKPAPTPTPAKAAKAKGFESSAPAVAPPAPVASTALDMLQEVDNDDMILKVVRLNAMIQERADMGVTLCRGERPHSLGGLFPMFALQNHSCAPNSVALVVGDRCVARCVASVPAGQQVTTSYFEAHGNPGMVFAPVEHRREFLKERCGFVCMCSRCKEEADMPEPVRSAITQAYEAATDVHLMTEARTAINVNSAEAKEAALARVQPYIDKLEGWMRAFPGAFGDTPDEMAQVKQRLRASAYAMYELAACLRDGPDDDGEIPWLLVPIVQAVAQAGDMHLTLLYEALNRKGSRHGRDDKRTIEFTKALLAAYLVRYGTGLPREKLTKLMEARVKRQSYMGRTELLRA